MLSQAHISADALAHRLRETETRCSRIEESLLRERELLQRIFDTVPLMMTVYEPTTKVLRVNRAFEQVIGWSSAEVGTVSLMEKCYPDPAYREMAREFMQACRPEWRDFRVRTRDGRDVEATWTNVRLSDESQLGIGIDITARKRTEEALRAGEEALRHEHRLKDEFLATLSHELRNPLAPMRSAVDILRMVERSDPEDKALAILDRQVSLMVRLVDDLLDVSRISSRKIELRPERLDLSTVVRRTLDGSRSLFEEKDHRLSFTTDAKAIAVNGDPVRLLQVFSNLLNNAAKFTPPRGQVSITVTRDGDAGLVRVEDTGIGIAAEMLPRIFGMFEQVDRSVDRAHDGLGIGLSLAKHLVEAHGGTVHASSEGLGRGSAFVVRLPLANAAARPRESDAKLRVEGSPKRASARRRASARTVLVVDDNVDAADTLGHILSTAGHRVFIAYDGHVGVELAKTHTPDAILMDLGMPGMSGYEAAKRMRSQPELSGVLLVAMSGWGQEQARRASTESGFDHHVVKPADIKTLEAILRRQA